MLMRIRVPFPRRITICIIKISTKRVAQALDNQKAPSGKIPPEWFGFPIPLYGFFFTCNTLECVKIKYVFYYGYIQL